MILGLYLVFLGVSAEDRIAFITCLALGIFIALFGMWLVGTYPWKITFNQSAGYAVVSRTYWPLFLWFLRKKRISREEAQSVFIRQGVRDVSTGSISSPTFATIMDNEVRVVSFMGVYHILPIQSSVAQ